MWYGKINRLIFFLRGRLPCRCVVFGHTISTMLFGRARNFFFVFCDQAVKKKHTQYCPRCLPSALQAHGGVCAHPVGRQKKKGNPIPQKKKPKTAKACAPSARLAKIRAIFSPPPPLAAVAMVMCFFLFVCLCILGAAAHATKKKMPNKKKNKKKTKKISKYVG